MTEHLKAWLSFLSIRSGVARIEGKASLSFLSEVVGLQPRGWGRGTTIRWSFKIWGMEPCEAGTCC